MDIRKLDEQTKHWVERIQASATNGEHLQYMARGQNGLIFGVVPSTATVLLPCTAPNGAGSGKEHEAPKEHPGHHSARDSKVTEGAPFGGGGSGAAKEPLVPIAPN